jgi:hypothetical protein
MSVEAKSALISTAKVEIKTLTLNGKQMTLAVFRQLPHYTLMTYGRAHADLWGWVNHHPSSACGKGDFRDHRHIIAVARDGELIRGCIERPSEVEVYDLGEEALLDWKLACSLPQLYIAV